MAASEAEQQAIVDKYRQVKNQTENSAPSAWIFTVASLNVPYMNTLRMRRALCVLLPHFHNKL